MSQCTLPLIIGGDFNLVRKVEDKSSGNVNIRWMQAFNDTIDDISLKELHRGGSRYTWSNKQEDPIQSVLDRVFVSIHWEDHYNLVIVYSATRVGSDHNALVVSLVYEAPKPCRHFRFDPIWLTHEDFKCWVIGKWPLRFKMNCLDHWHVVSHKLRSVMKGCSANFESGMRKHKHQLLLRLERLLDLEADNNGLSSQQWRERYAAEKELQHIYSIEEIYWQKRGGNQMALRGRF